VLDKPVRLIWAVAGNRDGFFIGYSSLYHMV
jgi:hypothetical protein